MSFRTEEKLYIRQENLIDFKKFIFNLSGKKIHKPRKIKVFILITQISTCIMTLLKELFQEKKN